MVEMGSAEMRMGGAMMGMNNNPGYSAGNVNGWTGTPASNMNMPQYPPMNMPPNRPMNMGMMPPQQGMGMGMGMPPAPGWGYPPAPVITRSAPSSQRNIFVRMLGIPSFGANQRRRAHQAELEYRRAQVIREAALRDVNLVPASLVYPR